MSTAFIVILCLDLFEHLHSDTGFRICKGGRTSVQVYWETSTMKLASLTRRRQSSLHRIKARP